MLTLDKLNRMKNAHYLTVEHSIIRTMYFTFSGATSIDKLAIAMPHIERRTLLMHIRKSVYMSHDEKGIVRLHRTGKDIYQYGKLYDDFTRAPTMTDCVFSILYNNYSMPYKSVCSILTTNNVRNRAVFCSNERQFHYIKKIVKKWLVAQGKM
jgi:hypothetical protein